MFCMLQVISARTSAIINKKIKMTDVVAIFHNNDVFTSVYKMDTLLVHMSIELFHSIFLIYQKRHITYHI